MVRDAAEANLYRACTNRTLALDDQHRLLDARLRQVVVGRGLDRIAALDFHFYELQIRDRHFEGGHVDPHELLASEDYLQELVELGAPTRPPDPAWGRVHDRPGYGPGDRGRLFNQSCRLIRKLGGEYVVIRLHNEDEASSREQALAAVAADQGIEVLVETYAPASVLRDPVVAQRLGDELGIKYMLDASHYIAQGLDPSAWAR